MHPTAMLLPLASQPAFPTAGHTSGMPLRTWLAGLCLAQLASSVNLRPDHKRATARTALALADALLAELAGEQFPPYPPCPLVKEEMDHEQLEQAAERTLDAWLKDDVHF